MNFRHLAPVRGGVAALLGGALILAGTSANAQTAAALFDNTYVHEIRLSMHGADWATLQARYLENTYYPADFAWNGYVVRNVGVRSRGSGSRDPRKPGLKIAFDEFVGDQTFAGLKSVALDNFRQDAGMMKESLSMQLFQRMGIAAPRVVHARVYINNDYLGLFAMIEAVDKRFLKSALGESGGYLYEFEWSGTYRFEWLSADPMRYAPMFAPKTHEDDPPDVLWGHIAAMVETANHASRHEWESAMARFVDFESLLAYLAVESYLSDHDGFAGDWGLNNFYLYRYQDRDRFVVIPWDKDVNFRELERSVFEGTADHALFSTALSYPRLRDIYVAALRRCAAIADAREADGGTAGWLEREVARTAAMIRASAVTDTTKAYTNERFEQEVAWMLRFARYRGADVLEQVR